MWLATCNSDQNGGVLFEASAVDEQLRLWEQATAAVSGKWGQGSNDVAGRESRKGKGTREYLFY